MNTLPWQKRPLFGLGRLVVRAAVKMMDALDKSGIHSWTDAVFALLFALALLLVVIRAFMAAPAVTGSLLGTILFVGVSVYTYLKHRK